MLRMSSYPKIAICLSSPNPGLFTSVYRTDINDVQVYPVSGSPEQIEVRSPCLWC